MEVFKERVRSYFGSRPSSSSASQPAAEPQQSEALFILHENDNNDNEQQPQSQQRQYQHHQSSEQHHGHGHHGHHRIRQPGEIISLPVGSSAGPMFQMLTGTYNNTFMHKHSHVH